MPAASSVCPDAQVLKQLLLGQRSDPEAESLGQHLLQCSRCAATVQSLKAEDTLVEAMRKAQADTAVGAEDKVVKGLIHKLCDMRASLATPPTAWPSGSLPQAAPQPVEVPKEEYDFLAPAQAPDEIGRLGPYRILKVLGAGGMGVVFLAEDPQLERRVALKAMKPALAASASARQRFLREAKATAAIEHDHIVTVYQVGEDRGVPFLAMQLLQGETLDDRLRREGKLPLPEALRIGREIAEGLAAAHERGLIHRDIKPSNIWLERRNEPQRHRDTEKTPREKETKEKEFSSSSSLCLGVSVVSSFFRVKILDFGLARDMGNQAHLTRSGDIVGTPSYMAPEQAQGKEVDHRCDLFSLGCVLYRMCTGEMAFKGDNMLAVLFSLTMEHPKSPRQLDPDLPPALSNLVMRLLAKDRADRPSSARAVVKEIETIEREVASVGKERTLSVARGLAEQPAKPPAAAPDSTDPWQELTSATEARPARPVPARMSRTWASRRLPLAIAAVLLLAVIALATFAVIRITTDNGTVVIETTDPDVEVVILQGGREVAILDKKTKQEIRLNAGTYEVQLKGGKEGLTLETQEFTLKRGDKQIVKVYLDKTLAGAGSKSEKPPTAKSEADAAFGSLFNGKDLTGWVLDVEPAKAKLCQVEDGELVVSGPSGTGGWLLTKQDYSDFILRFEFQLSRSAFTNIALRETPGGPFPYLNIYLHDDTNPVKNPLNPRGDPHSPTGALRWSHEIVQEPHTRANLKPVGSWNKMEIDMRGKLLRVWVNGGEVLNSDLRTLAGLSGAVPALKRSSGRIAIALPLNPCTVRFRNIEIKELDTPKPAADPDRQAAEWALKRKGKVWLWGVGAVPRVEDLPKESFKVQAIHFWGITVPDEELVNLKGLTDLRTFHIPNTALRDEGLAHLRDLTSLTDLHLADTQITDAGMVHLQKLTNLNHLNIGITKVGDAGLVHLKGIRGLTSLDLSYTQVGDEGLAHLKDMTSLVLLKLRNTRVTGTGLAHLKSHRRLETLELMETPLDDAGLAHIKGLTGLRTLHLWSTKVSDEGLVHLKPLTGLQGLGLKDCRGVGDAGMIHLKSLKGLTRLSLEGTRVGTDGLPHLATLSGLTELVLTNTSVKGLGLARLKELKYLQVLWLYNNGLTDDDLAHLQVSTSLQSLIIGGNPIGDEGLVHLKRLANLTGELNLQNTRVSDVGLEQLKGFTKLRKLELGGTRVTTDGIRKLKEALPDCKIESDA